AAHLVAYRYFKKANYSEQLITTFLIYACQITFSILFLGVIVKELGFPWIFLFNAAISLPVIWVLRKTIKKSIHHSHEKILGFSKDIFRAKDFFLYLFVFLFLTQIVLLLIKIYYLPSHVWDAFAYHLHPIAEWTQQDMIPPAIDSSVTRINRNPLGSKVFHLWSFMSIGDIRWIELPQFIFGLIVTLTSYSLMVKLNLRKTSALKYAILIFFIPAILIESRTCQDHLVLTGAIMIAVLYFINIFYQKQFSQIPFLALSLGLLLGIKISSPQVILVLFIALLAGKGFDRKQVWEFLSKNRAKIGAGLLIILALGSYWFFRNSTILESYSIMARRVFPLKVLLIICLLSAIIFAAAKLKNRKIIVAAAVIAVLLGSYGIFSHMALLKTFLTALQSPKPLLSGPALYEQYPLLKLTRSRFQHNLLLFPFRIKDTGAYMPYSPSLWKQSGFGVQFFTFGLISYIIMAGLFIAKKKYRTGIPGFIFIFSTLLLGSYFFYYFSDVNYRMFM
ncbi:MAG: hypothetical protein GY950_08765, partial [bacterium]|nr:hypothetical protein [bacterium]